MQTRNRAIEAQSTARAFADMFPDQFADATEDRGSVE